MRTNFALTFAVVILLVAAALRLYRLLEYPPGPHYDEAANILITRSIAYDGANLFPIANSYQGRESLYYYLNAPLFWFVGDDDFVLRISSVFINLITISASIALGRVMFPGRRGVMVGLAVGVLMTVSFHQLFMSRQAYRAVTLPMMQALALLFLWRGLCTSRRGWLVLGGVFAGGALYTYMASRLFPVWLGVGGIALLVFDRARWRARLEQGVWFFGALLVAALPMLLYAAQNPDIFFQRLDEVTTGDVTVSLTESIRRHLAMFFITGDYGNLRYNIPGRPYFTLPEGVLLLLGLGIAAWGVLRLKQPPLVRAGYVLLLLSPLMVLPSVVSVSGFPPSHMRSLGMVPLIFVVVAVGLEAVFTWVWGWFKAEKRVLTALMVFLGAVLLVGGASVGRAYMNWAARADLFYQADGDLAAAAVWLPENVAPETSLYVASFHREHPTLIALMDRPVTWLGLDSFFLPPAGEEAVAVFAHGAAAQWADALPEQPLSGLPQGPDGTHAFDAYHLSGDDASQPPADAAHNPYMTLIDVYGDPIAAGETGVVTMVWRIDQIPPYYRLRPVLDVRFPNETLLTSTDAFLLGTNQWRPGETMYQRMTIRVPIGTPPGDYPLSVTWIDRDSETYVSYIGDGGAHAGITAEVGAVEVIRPESFPSPEALAMTNEAMTEVAPGVMLLGWHPAAETARPGESLRPVLFWQGIEGERGALPLRAMLGDTVLWEGTLAHPPPQWRTGELVTAPMIWRIPAAQPAGRYTLTLYAGEMLVALQEVQVEGLPRVMTPPAVAATTEAVFGDAIQLYGYTLDVQNKTIQIDLIWSALVAVNIDYTIFVHLVDEDGQIVQQHDAMPQQNTYPTSWWLPGEYVQDSYRFENVPAGRYTLHVGLYEQYTGVRMFIRNGLIFGDNFVLNTVDIRN
ncbi:MAG: hypothetical protein OHK0046_28840 [Anaerolineae bacterium]